MATVLKDQVDYSAHYIYRSDILRSEAVWQQDHHSLIDTRIWNGSPGRSFRIEDSVFGCKLKEWRESWLMDGA